VASNEDSSRRWINSKKHFNNPKEGSLIMLDTYNIQIDGNMFRCSENDICGFIDGTSFHSTNSNISGYFDGKNFYCTNTGLSGFYERGDFYITLYITDYGNLKKHESTEFSNPNNSKTSSDINWDGIEGWGIYIKKIMNIPHIIVFIILCGLINPVGAAIVFLIYIFIRMIIDVTCQGLKGRSKLIAIVVLIVIFLSIVGFFVDIPLGNLDPAAKVKEMYNIE